MSTADEKTPDLANLKFEFGSETNILIPSAALPDALAETVRTIAAAAGRTVIYTSEVPKTTIGAPAHFVALSETFSEMLQLIKKAMAGAPVGELAKVVQVAATNLESLLDSFKMRDTIDLLKAMAQPVDESLCDQLQVNTRVCAEMMSWIREQGGGNYRITLADPRHTYWYGRVGVQKVFVYVENQSESTTRNFARDYPEQTRFNNIFISASGSALMRYADERKS